MYFFFDTETTGLPKDYNARLNDFQNWPRIVQLSYLFYGCDYELLKEVNFIVRPDGFTIPESASTIHGITTERALKEGVPLDMVLKAFNHDRTPAKYMIAHNIDFDAKIIGAELWRTLGDDAYHELVNKNIFKQTNRICTMKTSVDFCKLPGKYGFKWPKLTELHETLFPGERFAEAHNSLADVKATARCFFEMEKRGIISL